MTGIRNYSSIELCPAKTQAFQPLEGNFKKNENIYPIWFTSFQLFVDTCGKGATVS